MLAENGNDAVSFGDPMFDSDIKQVVDKFAENLYAQ